MLSDEHRGVVEDNHDIEVAVVPGLDAEECIDSLPSIHPDIDAPRGDCLEQLGGVPCWHHRRGFAHRPEGRCSTLVERKPTGGHAIEDDGGGLCE